MDKKPYEPPRITDLHAFRPELFLNEDFMANSKICTYDLTFERVTRIQIPAVYSHLGIALVGSTPKLSLLCDTESTLVDTIFICLKPGSVLGNLEPETDYTFIQSIVIGESLYHFFTLNVWDDDTANFLSQELST